MYIKYEPIFPPLNSAWRGGLSAEAGTGRRVIKLSLAVRLIVRVRIIYRGLVTRPINPSVEYDNYFDRITIPRNLGTVLLLIGPFHVPAGSTRTSFGYHPLDGHRFPPPPLSPPLPLPRRRPRSHPRPRVTALRVIFSNLLLAQERGIINNGYYISTRSSVRIRKGEEEERRRDTLWWKRAITDRVCKCQASRVKSRSTTKQI